MFKIKYPIFVPLIAVEAFILFGVKSAELTFLFAYLHMLLLLFIVLQTGGLYKGSTTYENILFFLVIDLLAFFSLSLSYPWVYWVLLLPGLARVLFPLTAPYARSIFFNCPTQIMILILVSMVPVGLTCLARVPIHCPNNELLEVLCIGSSLLATTLFLIEKSRRQRAVFLLMIQSPLCVHLLLKQQALGTTLCLLAVLNSCIWLYFLELPRVRLFNMGLAAATILWLVIRP